MRSPRYKVHVREQKPKPRQAPKVPLRASACVMTPVPASHEKTMRYVALNGDVPPGKAPTALVLYFDGFGMRRVYRRKSYATDKPHEYTGKHYVVLNGKRMEVDITTMALVKPDA